ncbi:MAG: amidohydrolase [Firmicutes bacterium HGW-Firmicutes-14]|nr:MAG: amidohydrolase [Firmicutes bacterium HGW-Firmicutes-14]
MMRQVLREADRIQPELVEIRRQIHKNPELGFEEWETAQLIHKKISRQGLLITGGIARTGIAALLQVKGANKTVALRADMDALPIEEQADVPYKSAKKGVMHACGHDAHVAMLIGAQKILCSIKPALKVNVKFIFQPCEEQLNGGAQTMIKEGVMENPRVDAIFGFHVNPYMPSGFVGIKEGIVMAAADRFRVEIKGRGGHAAAPHQATDPIIVASHVVQALQNIVSRQVDPAEPVVVSVCSIQGGNSFNIIPALVVLAGTVRTIDPNIQQQMPERIKEIVRGVTSAFGAGHTVDYRWGCPALVNNREMTEIVRSAGAGIVGSHRVLVVTTPSMGAEDFAFFTGLVPGAYFFLGVKSNGSETYPWHNPMFDIDESALSTGAALLAGCVLCAQEKLEETG